MAVFAALDDYQHYSPELLVKLARRASQAGACGLLTTEKDMVKLAALRAPIDLPLLGLRMQVTAAPELLAGLLAPLKATDGSATD